MQAIVYDASAVDSIESVDLDEVPALLQGDRTFWLDVSGVGDGVVLRELASTLGIHPLAIADVVHVPQRPKVEAYEDHHVVILQMLQAGAPFAVDFEQVTIVVGPRWVVSFQERPGDVFDPVRARLRHGLGSLRDAGASYLAYALVDAIVDAFFPVLEELGEELARLEEEALRLTHPHRSLHDLHTVRRLLIRIHRVLWAQRDAVRAMLREHGPWAEGSVTVYLRDTYDHSVQLLDLLEISRDLAAAILEIHLSSISNRMNEIMKTLTVMASIFIPLTFLTGVYGMNFRHMPELEWRLGYPSFWVSSAVIAVGLLVWFRRRGWIGRSGTDSDG